MGQALNSASVLQNEDPAATILVVEDETVIATDLELTLRRMGYHVLAPVASADEALEAVRAHHPDLILMDIRIQGDCDGIEAAARIRRLYNLPVVYLTAHGDNATLERAKATGPLGFLLKPFRARELHATIDMALHRHHVERKIVENGRWLSTVLNSINDAVVVTDQDANVSMLNLRAREIMRRTDEESLGRPIEQVMDLVRIGDAQPVVPSLREAISQAHAVQANEETMLLVSDGHRVVIDENSAPILEKGEVIGGVTAFRDVTERSALRRQAEFTNRLTALGTLAAGFAHEVNTPLTVITGNLELVDHWVKETAQSAGEDPSTSEDTTDFDVAVRDIRTSVERIGSLVADLSGFGKPGQGMEQRADVNKCIRWALTSVRAAFVGKSQITVDAPPIPFVRLDERRVGQVLINLMTNALQALNPENFARNKVTVRAFVGEDANVIIEVSDTGSGIPGELQAHIFDPFVTGKASTGGTGLGLFICKNIVTGAGGTLTFETAPGVGTVFRVSLPVAD